jgi:hypothetical protein
MPCIQGNFEIRSMGKPDDHLKLLPGAKQHEPLEG